MDSEVEINSTLPTQVIEIAKSSQVGTGFRQTTPPLLFKKQQEQGRRRGPAPAASPERLVTARVEVPGHVGREYVLPASLLGHQRLAPLMAEAEAEYGVQQGDVIRVPCRPCHFVDAMVWAAVEEAMQGGTAHGAAVVPVIDSGKDSGNRHDLGWYLARPH